MNQLCRIFLVITLALTSLWSSAQIPVAGNPVSNLRKKTFRIDADSIKVDTISIVPNTFFISNVVVEDYRIDYVKAILYWKKKPIADTVTITYRVFPFKLNPVAQRMNYDSVMNNFYQKPFEFNNGLAGNQRGVFDFGTLKAEGSLGRQIGFGNSQDAVVNSSLNLQLSGMLGDSIEIQAAITDNNIPIQPDGTTQQLNEFDQVFLQFKKRGWQLNLGDIDIRQNQNYFLNFYKRLQGISFKTENRLSKSISSRTLVSGSIAKGKFNRQILDPLEGNQGPYRLRGPNNELFFVVLANTERVFYDGQLLQRGEDQDYVINYNSAEITFTPRRMITKDSRIQVEFEYAERNYLNTNLYLSQEFEINQKLKIRLGAFNNNDAKNSPINQVLDTRQKQFLADLGDSTQNAFYPTALIDSFAADKILYEKIVVGLDSFYQYSTNPATAKFSLSFVDVKQGNGNYVPEFNGANGKVYKYLPPVAGIKQGQYEPVQILVAPRRQQIVNLGIDYAIDKNTLVKAEVATSNNDVNTFSTKQDGDDRGWATKVQLSNKKMLRAAKKLELTTGLDYEYVQSKFKPLERLRNVEFTRDWGLTLFSVPVNENIIRVSAGLKDKNNHAVSYQFINYNRSDNYNGFQNVIKHNADWKGWRFNNQFTVTNFNVQNDKGTFLRPTLDLSKQLKKMDNWRVGLNYALEQSTSRYKTNDTLTPTAFSFDIYSAYLKSDESKKNKYGITFFTRSDKYPVGKEFVRGDRSLNLNLQTELLANPKRQFYLNTTFRKLKVYNATLSRQKEDETILGRAEYVMNEWKGLLTGTVLYEVGAGQEQRRDFAYLEVPAGQGEYAWIDYNNDGIQQLNEFELAAFPDQAKFIRVFTPTNDFIKANYITFNYRLDISPRAVLNSPNLKGAKKLLSKLNLLTSFQTSKKSVASGGFEFNPFKYGVNDTALITLSTTILNTLSFNRFSSKWGFDFSNYRNNGKSLLTYGYESRKINDWSVKWRWNINRSLALTVNGKIGTNALYTPQFTNRNYQLSVYTVEPSVIYIKGTKFRIVSSYKFDSKKNLPLYGNEKSISNSLNLESRYNILQRSSLTGKFTFNNINYDSPANTTVSYIMLDGLLPGKNFLWSLGFNKRLINNLELNFQYDGRKAGSSRTVHLGRAGVTAL
ncbi:MAG TPA: hypothetical protein PK298_08445, partial [Chitinophagaceae bacterium]|nr:hypothetical protein [Chitinophagaceae bacterium]